MTCEQFKPKPLILNDRDFYFLSVIASYITIAPVNRAGKYGIGLWTQPGFAEASLLAGLRSWPRRGRPRSYSYANASIGSFCAAFIAGYAAPSIDPMTAIMAARINHSGVIRMGSV